MSNIESIEVIIRRADGLKERVIMPFDKFCKCIAKSIPAPALAPAVKANISTKSEKKPDPIMERGPVSNKMNILAIRFRTGGMCLLSKKMHEKANGRQYIRVLKQPYQTSMTVTFQAMADINTFNINSKSMIYFSAAAFVKEHKLEDKRVEFKEQDGVLVGDVC